MFEVQSHFKVLLPCGLKQAEEKVLKLIQQETSSEVFEEKQMFAKTRKGGD